LQHERRKERKTGATVLIVYINKIKMEQERTHLQDVAQKANDYLNTKLELTELKAIEYGSITFGAILSKLILIVVGFLCLIFISLGIALFISVYSGNSWLGYLVVASFYLLAFIILYFNRGKWLSDHFSNAFIKRFEIKKENGMESLKELQARISVSQAQSKLEQAILHDSIGNFAESMKPENIILNMLGKMVNRFFNKKEKEAEEKQDSEEKQSEFKESLLQILTKLASQALTKGVDVLSKKVFK
jgi:hypothetical protein